MKPRRLELTFTGRGDVQLFETRFTDIGSTTPRVSIRGKTAGAFRYAGTFQWTSAVRALCILVVKSVVAYRCRAEDSTRHLVGTRGSLAASLDYAITKQPQWIRAIFGADPRESSIAQRLIARTNPNRKRPGPVILAINEEALAPTNIELIWDGRPVKDACDLQALLLGLGASDQSAVSVAAHTALTNEGAA